MSDNELTENLDGYVKFRLGALQMPVTEKALDRVKTVALDLETSAAFVRKDLPFSLEPIIGAATHPVRAKGE